MSINLLISLFANNTLTRHAEPVEAWPYYQIDLITILK
jgi:hypothetical protein